MKRKMLIFLMVSFCVFSNTKIPQIEKVEGVKPWWLNNHKITEGVLEGIGIVSKSKGDSSTYRAEATELAKAEIAGIKNTYVDSTVILEQNNDEKSMNISTKGTSTGMVKAVLIDTYEDSENYYVWMAEFYNAKAQSNFVTYLNDKNRETLENKLEYIKYLNKVVVTNKKRSKITINGGTDKGYKKNEILNVYRLTEASLNPMTKELNDFSKEKVGEIVVEEVFDSQTLASADILSTFKVKEGDIVVSSGTFKEDKEAEKEIKVTKLHTKYNYNLNYEPQVLYVERSRILGPRQYEISLMSDFDNRSDMNFKFGLLRFVEGSAGFNLGNQTGMNAMIKIAFPIIKSVNMGMAFKRDLDNQLSYAMGLLEYSFYENAGFLDFNITSPVGESTEKETFGTSIQVKPDKDVLIAAEYNSEVENTKNDMVAIKLNLKMLEDTWIGGGVIWDENTTYFLRISKIAIF